VNSATTLPLREFHQTLGARFTTVHGVEVVADFGDALAEHDALRETAGVLDLSFRSRLCLTGADRVRFLHGQVTNDVKRLRAGEGCYAALVTAKGKMESDLNIHCLQDELLLDFEPGLTAAVAARLEKYIVADDVQVVDVAPHYGLLSVQGPKAEAVVRSLGLFGESDANEPTPNPSTGGEQIPAASAMRSSPPGRGQGWVGSETKLPKPFQSAKISDATLGEIYLVNQPRLGEGSRRREEADEQPQPVQSRLLTSAATNVGNGFDLFVPTAALDAVMDKLIAAAKEVGGRACGWTAFEMARIEAGIPRFGVDMDATNIPLECGIESRAVSYTKGCYIGQEVINRIHSIGHVNRELRGLRLADDLKTLPVKGDKLFKDGKEVGYITSALASPALKANIALGYVRREAGAIGTELTMRTGDGESGTKIVELPFGK
jgi:tRNA-modifying protein YgfZ